MGSVFVEPLKERSRVGEVFVSHVSEDEARIRESVIGEFISQGIPYFLSDEDIPPGEDWLERLEQAITRASCGAVVLTENSLDSEWVWYEAGLLEGLNKPIYPLFFDDIDVSRVPEFITRRQLIRDTPQLVETIQEDVHEFGAIAERTDFDATELRRVTVTMTLDTEGYPTRVVESLSFGYQLIGFGSPGGGRDELLLMPIDADSVVREANATKVEYSVPLHKTHGVEFKPYVTVEDTADVETVISMLDDDVFRDAAQSSSGERQRVYFLLPIGLNPDQASVESGNVIDDGDGNLNNWLYPQ